MTDKDRTLIEELEERLRWYREEATEEEFDAEAVDAICTMLGKLDPVEPPKSKEDAFEDLMRQIREKKESGEREADGEEPDEDDGEPDESSVGESDKRQSRKRRRYAHRKGMLRAAIITIAVVGALFSLDRVTYARENKSLFTMILEKVGWLEIEKEKGVVNTEISSGMMSGEFYNSWTELDAEIKEKLMIPQYIPEGYSLFGVRTWNYENREMLQADYYNQGNGHVLIEITLWKDHADHYKEMLPNEDIYTLLAEYSDEKTFYYEYGDEYICMSFMEDSFYRISGNITLEEMIKIRGGLGQTG